MELVLRTFLLAVIVILFATILNLLRRGSLALKYSLIWLAVSLALFILVLFPSLPAAMADRIGIEAASNFVFLLEGLFVLIILINLTVILSKQNARIVRLAQICATLEERIRRLEQKDKP